MGFRKCGLMPRCGMHAAVFQLSLDVHIERVFFECLAIGHNREVPLPIGGIALRLFHNGGRSGRQQEGQSSAETKQTPRAPSTGIAHHRRTQPSQNQFQTVPRTAILPRVRAHSCPPT